MIIPYRILKKKKKKIPELKFGLFWTPIRKPLHKDCSQMFWIFLLTSLSDEFLWTCMGLSPSSCFPSPAQKLFPLHITTSPWEVPFWSGLMHLNSADQNLPTNGQESTPTTPRVFELGSFGLSPLPKTMAMGLNLASVSIWVSLHVERGHVRHLNSWVPGSHIPLGLAASLTSPWFCYAALPCIPQMDELPFILVGLLSLASQLSEEGMLPAMHGFGITFGFSWLRKETVHMRCVLVW